jgi:hypothetical protein
MLRYGFVDNLKYKHILLSQTVLGFLQIVLPKSSFTVVSFLRDMSNIELQGAVKF